MFCLFGLRARVWQHCHIAMDSEGMQFSQMKRSNSPAWRNPMHLNTEIQFPSHLRSLSLSASILSCCSSLDRTGPPGAGLRVLLFLSTPEPPLSDLGHNSQVCGRNTMFVLMEIQIYPV